MTKAELIAGIDETEQMAKFNLKVVAVCRAIINSDEGISGDRLLEVAEGDQLAVTAATGFFEQLGVLGKQDIEVVSNVTH